MEMDAMDKAICHERCIIITDIPHNIITQIDDLIKFSCAHAIKRSLYIYLVNSTCVNPLSNLY